MTQTLIATPDPEPSHIIAQSKEFKSLVNRYYTDDVLDHISNICDEIKTMLITKNRKYGNSAINPIRIYSKLDPKEQLFVRIDDKLNRKLNRQNDEDEDIDTDLIGYLILSKAYDRLQK